MKLVQIILFQKLDDGEVPLRIKKFTVHPYYDPNVVLYDFAIIRIDNYQVIPDLRTVGVACLPLGIDPTHDFAGEKMKIVGWGHSEAGKIEDKLQVIIHSDSIIALMFNIS